jgi:hypothetical protein
MGSGMIISSAIASQSVQVDGSILVHEQHTSSDGTIYDHIYFADPSLDIDAVCTARGINIGAELVKKQATLEAATNFEIPITPVELMRRLTPSEWSAFQASTDTDIAYFRAIFNKTSLIYRNDPLTQAGFTALVSAGILDAQRVSEVLA